MKHTQRYASVMFIAIGLFSAFYFFKSSPVTKGFQLRADAEFIPGEVIMKVKSGVVVSDAFNKKHYLQSGERILAQHKTKGAVAESAKIFGLDRLYIAKLKSGENFEDTLRALNNDPLVEYAEPNILCVQN